MNRIPNIKMTKDEVYHLMRSQAFNYGGEALVCYSERPDTLYKIFTERTYSKTPAVIRDNKREKIALLYRIKPDHSTLPLRTISMNGEIIGYEMTTNSDFKTVIDLNLDRQSLIHVLKQSRKVLLYYASLGIVYGDVKEDNILFNPKTGEIMFCDMDNIQISSYPIDILGYDLKYYEQCRGTLDAKADAYMHNLMTLEALYYKNDATQDIISALRSHEFPSGLSHDVTKTLASMANPKDFDGKYIIQYIKKK